MNISRHGCISQEGFTLAETLIAMSLLSTIMLGSLGMLTLAQKTLAAGGKSLEVLAVAESGMETFRVMPYAGLLTPDLKDDHGGKLVLEQNGSGQFVGQQTVHAVNFVWQVIPDGLDLPKSAASTVKVSAEWIDARGQHRRLTLGLVRANPVYSGAVL